MTQGGRGALSKPRHAGVCFCKDCPQRRIPTFCNRRYRTLALACGYWSPRSRPRTLVDFTPAGSSSSTKGVAGGLPLVRNWRFMHDLGKVHPEYPGEGGQSPAGLALTIRQHAGAYATFAAVASNATVRRHRSQAAAPSAFHAGAAPVSFVSPVMFPSSYPPCRHRAKKGPRPRWARRRHGPSGSR